MPVRLAHQGNVCGHNLGRPWGSCTVVVSQLGRPANNKVPTAVMALVRYQTEGWRLRCDGGQLAGSVQRPVRHGIERTLSAHA